MMDTKQTKRCNGAGIPDKGRLLRCFYRQIREGNFMKKTWTPDADLVIRNARIYTVALTIDEVRQGKYDFPIYENSFVAAKDGKTIAVGEGDGATFIGSATEVIDAGGKTLVPGLIDSHMHALFAGKEMLGVELSGAATREEFIQRIAEHAAKTPAGKWVKGAGWNEMIWPDGKMPTRYDLDQVVPDHPAYFIRLCHHVYVANSKALAAAGITRDTPDPLGGMIGRDETGEPNGLLYENAAMNLMDDVAPAMTEDELIDAIAGVGRVMNGFGLTACIDCNLPFDEMRSYLQAKKRGRLTYRADLMFYLEKAWGDMPYHLQRIKEMVCVTGFGDDMLKMNGVKVTLDGIPATGTAAMREPYDHMPETKGDTLYTPEQMREMGELAGKYHWQIGLHCCGDRTADVAMDAFETAYAAAGNRDARHYIIHLGIAQPDQIPRLKALDVPVATQPTIGLQMGEQPVLGERLASRYMLCGSLLREGIIVGGSTDCPVVTCNPFEGMYAAVTRLGADGKVYLPQEAVTPAQALIMWTKNSAYFLHADDRMGSIEPGNLADYALIDTPILTASPDEIRSTRVLKTFVGGKTVYET